MDKTPPPVISAPAVFAPTGQIVPKDAATKAFVNGLIERGEAAKSDAQGNLPPEATHEIVGETSDGAPIVVRRRFKTF